jgi:hypothetical protein
MNFNITMITALLGFAFVTAINAQGREGVLARCGASKGTAYFFKEPVANPDGPNWVEDGMSKGRIVLVKLGEEFDIQFDDAAGSYGYREDGASVFLLGLAAGKMTVGAMHSNYTDIYTFNFMEKEVLWSSHKIGSLVTKVAIYRADCD